MSSYSVKNDVDKNNISRLVGKSIGDEIVKGKVTILGNEIPNKNKLGGILVVKKSDPSLTPFILSSKALVMEYGSFSAHLTKICMEFQKPCIFQVENACEKMVDWNSAEINPMEGVIYKRG